MLQLNNTQMKIMTTTMLKSLQIVKPEIQRILGQVSESANSQKTGISFEIGEKVKVCDGPFASFNGEIEQIDDVEEIKLPSPNVDQKDDKNSQENLFAEHVSD